MYKKALIGAGVMALSLAFLAGPADAAGKKGPRASVAAATVCDVVGSDLTVEIRARDKTSGDAVAVVSAWSIDALAKDDVGNWGNQAIIGNASASGLSTPVPTTIGPVAFSLCVADGLGGFVINPVVEGAKALNAMADTTYGRLNLDTLAVEDQRTIMNMCSDDPETVDVVEPSGIKLSDADIADIAAACLLLP